MEKEIGAVLREYRLKAGVTVKEISNILTSSGFKASEKTIYSWENGNSQPSPDALLKMCDAYGIDDILSAFGYDGKNEYGDIIPNYPEQQIISQYRKLDDYGKETILYLLDREVQRVVQLYEHKDDHISDGKKFIPEDIANPKLIKLPYFHKVASAGKGNYIFTDIPADMKEVISNDITERSDFAIGVDGNSMYPLYADGDIVFIKKTGHVPTGRVGLFQHNNEIVIKRVGEDRLISDNHNGYKDIFPDAGEIECLGEVTGKLIGNEVVSEEEIELLKFAASHLKKPKTSNGN